MMKKIIKLIFSILICNLAGFVGTLFTTPAIPTWYASLQKPNFNPPGWIFGPVWTVLYILMGISLFLVWNQGLKDKKAKMAISFFAIQLVLNSLWSIIFFGLQNPFLAFLEIIVLLIFILLTTFYFHKINKPAAYLLLPYILWVSFASFLNYNIWILNQ